MQFPKAVSSSAKSNASKGEAPQPTTGYSAPCIEPGKANSSSMMVTAQSFQEYYLRLFSILDLDYTVPLAHKKQTQEQIHCHQNN